jgi:hypothetical protein
VFSTACFRRRVFNGVFYNGVLQRRVFNGSERSRSPTPFNNAVQTTPFKQRRSNNAVQTTPFNNAVQQRRSTNALKTPVTRVAHPRHRPLTETKWRR